MKKDRETNPAEKMSGINAIDDLREYPVYPDREDIYNKAKKEENIDPEDISKVKKTDKSDDTPTNIGEESNDDEHLDVPGSELDDEQENIGSEDEENNYYSVGGDNHNNLDEDELY
jgi:hypothetical protein